MLIARNGIMMLGRLLGTASVALAVLAGDAGAQEKKTEDAAVSREELAKKAAEVWLQLVDDGHYQDSWEQAAEAFKAALTKETWEQAVFQARGPLEPFGERTLLSAVYTNSLPNAPPGEYVIMQYETAVAGERKVIETVVPMLDPDGTWRVSGYFVKPL